MRTNEHRSVYFVLSHWIIAICIGAGCAALKEQVLTPRETVLWGMKVYNAEWERYVKQTVKPEYIQDVIKDDREITNDMVRTDLSDEEWEVLETKKNILTDLFPIIEICDETVGAGNLPPEETRDDLIYLINRLIGE